MYFPIVYYCLFSLLYQFNQCGDRKKRIVNFTLRLKIALLFSKTDVSVGHSNEIYIEYLIQPRKNMDNIYWMMINSNTPRWHCPIDTRKPHAEILAYSALFLSHRDDGTIC